MAKKEKKKKCKNCAVFKDGECLNEGPILFVQLANRYCSLGYPKEEAGKKAFIQPVVSPKHSGCKHWRKKK